MYPYPLLARDAEIFPLLGPDYAGQPPHLFDFSSKSAWIAAAAKADLKNQHVFERSLQDQLQEHDGSWGLAGYLEHRTQLLAPLPQMVLQERFFHLGVDIIVPQGTALHAPLDARVALAGYDDGQGNFGAFVVLNHYISSSFTGARAHFYSLYGHLDRSSLPKEGDLFKAGDIFARVGSFTDNGQWFEHVHLQILTEQAFQEGFYSKGYCSKDMLPWIDAYCPSPLFLLRY